MKLLSEIMEYLKQIKKGSVYIDNTTASATAREIMRKKMDLVF